MWRALCERISSLASLLPDSTILRAAREFSARWRKSPALFLLFFSFLFFSFLFYGKESAPLAESEEVFLKSNRNEEPSLDEQRSEK